MQNFDGNLKISASKFEKLEKPNLMVAKSSLQNIYCFQCYIAVIVKLGNALNKLKLPKE